MVKLAKWAQMINNKIWIKKPKIEVSVQVIKPMYKPLGIIFIKT